jgi:hypothetical protein
MSKVTIITNQDLMNKLDAVLGLLQQLLNDKYQEEKITSISVSELAKRMGWGKAKTRARVKAAGIRYTEEPVVYKDGVVRNTMTVVEQDLEKLFTHSAKGIEHRAGNEIHVKDIRKEFRKIFELPDKSAERQGRSRKAG